jgi:hypothetical protein
MNPPEDGSGSPVQLTAYPHTLHGVQSGRNRSDGNDAQALSLLFNNTYVFVYVTSHAFPKRATNYDIHNSVGDAGLEGHCSLGCDTV